MVSPLIIPLVHVAVHAVAGYHVRTAPFIRRLLPRPTRSAALPCRRAMLAFSQALTALFIKELVTASGRFIV